MFDYSSEKLITLTEATRLAWMPRGRTGKGLHISTLLRWCEKGIPVKGLGFMRLESVRVGGLVCTTEPALKRFFEALGQKAEDSIPAPKEGRACA